MAEKAETSLIMEGQRGSETKLSLPWNSDIAGRDLT
jgi:hypothetical protein